MRRFLLVMVVTIAAGMAAAARGQQCDTHDPCMANGMCMPDGSCQGTPLNSGSCDIPGGDATCMVNGHCVNGQCTGDSAPAGTSCGAGCGTCELPFPGSPVLLCTTIPAQAGKACNPGLGACFTGVCGQAQFGFCQPTFKVCPDIDHNPCTTDSCNPSTGQCQHSDQPPCIPTCEVCNSGTGCQPANDGVACDDFDVCTTESHCEPFDTGAGIRGFCLPGAATVSSPTPTATQMTDMSPTPTPTSETGQCAGDCDHDGQVTVDELVLGVNILLESAQLSQCPSFDVDNSGAVEVNELVLGVGNLLNSCTP